METIIYMLRFIRSRTLLYLLYHEGQRKTRINGFLSDPLLAMVCGALRQVSNPQKYELVIVTKEKPFSGKYLFGIHLELLNWEEYDLACCWIASDSDSDN